MHPIANVTASVAASWPVHSRRGASELTATLKASKHVHTRPGRRRLLLIPANESPIVSCMKYEKTLVSQ